MISAIVEVVRNISSAAEETHKGGERNGRTRPDETGVTNI